MSKTLELELSCQHSIGPKVPKRIWAPIQIEGKDCISLKEAKAYLSKTEERYKLVRTLKHPSYIKTYLERGSEKTIQNYRHIRIRQVSEVRKNQLEDWIEKELGF